MTSFAVVLLTLVEGEWVDFARFDSAHGCPHEDVLGRKTGLLQKVWHDGRSYGQAYELAINRFRNDDESIRREYLAH